MVKSKKISKTEEELAEERKKLYSCDWQNLFLPASDNLGEIMPRRSVDYYFIMKEKPLREFVTGSTFKGTWNKLGMHGQGLYNFFYHVNYDGHMGDNMCHGSGNLNYPNGGRMEGVWSRGHMISHRYFFPDGLCFGPYCEMPDRRFILEHRFGLKPGGRTLEINSFKHRPIPAGCYDVGDGFYHPIKKCVFDEDEPNKIVRIPTSAEHAWILKHCRKAWDEPAGYRPDLYENWNKNEFRRSESEQSIDSKTRDFPKTDYWKTDFSRSYIESIFCGV